MKICQYVPHGAIPDKRGFAPAIVAQNIVKSFNKDDYYFISNAENYKQLYEDSEYGRVFRIKCSLLYDQIFTKITRLDPYPLHYRAAKIVNKYPVDVFHAHQLEFPVNEFKKKLYKIPKIVLHVHAIRSFDESRGIADLYLAVSKYTKQKLIERGFPENRIKVLYNGVDIDRFSCDKNEILILKRRLSIPQNNIIISYIGRKQEGKGAYTALQIFEKLLKKYNNITCMFIGPTPKDGAKSSYKDIRNLIKKLSFHNNFIDLPALPHKEITTYFKISDIVLFPTKRDQHPLVSVEAMASKSILIASNLSSIPEYVKNEENGFLINDPENIKEILNVTEKIIKNISNFEYIKENAFKTAKELFDWKAISNKLLDYYEEIKGMK